MRLVATYCRRCGRRGDVPVGVPPSTRVCSDPDCMGRLVSEVTLARAAGFSRGAAFRVRLIPAAERVRLLAAHAEAKSERRRQLERERETRTEVRDGREFTVTTIPTAEPPKRRSHDSHYHMGDVGKAGDHLPLVRRRRR